MAFHKHVRWIHVELTWVRPGRIQVPSRASGRAWLIDSETPKTWCFGGRYSPRFKPEQTQVDETGVGTVSGLVLDQTYDRVLGTFAGKITGFVTP